MMIDGILNSLHDRYSDQVASLGRAGAGHWERLMCRLEDINDSIQDGPGEDIARMVYNVSPAAGSVPLVIRTLRTGESLLLETISADAVAGNTIIRLDGQLRYARAFTSIITFDGLNCVIQGPGEVTIETVTAANFYIQFRYMLRNPQDHPKKSAAGERGIGGVDPRENPGAADQGRHSLMGETMIGRSSINN